MMKYERGRRVQRLSFHNSYLIIHHFFIPAFVFLLIDVKMAINSFASD